MDRSVVQLAEALRDPAAFPHGVKAVAVRETHISWVFLTGEFAYKVKKPVRTNFLDFSTLEKRRRFCEEEVRLNRRFAPRIYLHVTPITGNPSAPIVGGDGPPIEYAVKMRQFSEAGLLKRMLMEDALKPDHIDELAEEVADFHELAERVQPGNQYGMPGTILREALENVETLRRLLPPQFDPDLQIFQDWTLTNAEQLDGTFLARRRDGFVRECHGDLHLGNLVLLDDHVTLFDGIEFNPEFRWIDIVSDAVFAMMDLADRGRLDLANRFLNAYLERTGDYSALAVVPWYFIYRALVRAKVAAIRGSQPETTSQDRATVHQECLEYARLAKRFLHRPSPRLLITCGVSGSGKTTGTQDLIEQQGVIRVRSDVERKRLFGLAPDAPSGSALGEGIYTETATRRTYDRLADCARTGLAAGFSVVVDATFLRHDDRARFRRLAAERDVPFTILLFGEEESLLRSRVRTRTQLGSDASEGDVAVLERQLATRERLTPSEREHCRTISDILAS